MKRYEYKKENEYHGYIVSDSMLNEWGLAGWDIVGYTVNNGGYESYLFKRELTKGQ